MAKRRDPKNVSTEPKPKPFSQRASFVDGQGNRLAVRAQERRNGTYRVFVEHAAKGPKGAFTWARGLHESFLAKEPALTKFADLVAEVKTVGWRERVGGIRNLLVAIPKAK